MLLEREEMNRSGDEAADSSPFAICNLQLSFCNYSRTLRWAAWLGWQIDSNWANPWLFILYVLVKPLAGSLLLVCMYWAARSATDAEAAPGYLPFLYVSTACFMLVGGITYGMSHAV